HREQSTPRVAHQVHPFHSPDRAQRLEVVHLLACPDGNVAPHRRAAATALVVVDQCPAIGQAIESGEEIVVMRTRPAVQHHHFGAAADPAIEDGDSAHLAFQRGHFAGHSRSPSAPATSRTACTSASPNGSTWSESTSICP